MARILGIDYGLKKCGLSVTDPLQIIVTPLTSLLTVDLEQYVLDYCKAEEVEKIVIGRPAHKDGTDTYLVSHIDEFVKKISKKIPEMIFDFGDESHTSSQAREIIFKSGAKKSKRRDKMLVDKISAVLILQRYLRHI